MPPSARTGCTKIEHIRKSMRLDNILDFITRITLSVFEAFAILFGGYLST